MAGRIGGDDVVSQGRFRLRGNHLNGIQVGLSDDHVEVVGQAGYGVRQLDRYDCPVVFDLRPNGQIFPGERLGRRHVVDRRGIYIRRRLDRYNARRGCDRSVRVSDFEANRLWTW